MWLERRDSIILFIIIFIMGLFLYGYELTNFSLSIDEEFTNNFFHTIHLGRFGESFLKKYFLPSPYLPYFTLLGTIFFLTMSTFIFTRYIDFNFEDSILFSALFICFPQFAYQVEFSNQSDTVALGIFLACLSAILFDIYKQKKNKFFLLFFILLVICSLSMYQSIILCIVNFFLVLVLNKTYKNYFSFRKLAFYLFEFFIWLLLATIIYILIWKFLLKIYGMSEPAYLLSRIHWSKDSIYSCIVNIYKILGNFLTGRGDYGLNIYVLATLSFILSSLYLLLKKKYLQFLITFLIYLCPFTMLFLYGDILFPREIVSMNISFAAILYFTAYNMRINKNVMKIFTLTVYIICCSYITRMFWSDHMTYQSNLLTANRILFTIYNNYPNFDSQVDKVYFHGALYENMPWKIKNSNTFNYSFYTWDGGNLYRIIDFFSYNGLGKFIPASPDDIRNILNDVKKLPHWPNPHSVAYINNIMVIKLGKEIGYCGVK